MSQYHLPKWWFIIRQPLYFQRALNSFIVENEIKLIRALKNRDGEEMRKELGVIYPEPEKADEGHSKNDQLYANHYCWGEAHIFPLHDGGEGGWNEKKDGNVSRLI